MKRFLCLLVACLLISGPALAQPAVYEREGFINDALPEMRFSFEITGKQTNRDGETEYIYTATVTEASPPHATVQSFECLSLEQFVPDTLGFYAVLQDVNFDGYMDLDICYRFELGGMEHRFFLWNPDAGQFEPSNLHEQIRAMYALYPDAKIIHVYIQDSELTSQQLLYQWQGDKLTRIRKMVTTYDSSYRFFALLVDYTVDPDAILMDETYPDLEAFIDDYDAREDALWIGLDAGEPVLN